MFRTSEALQLANIDLDNMKSWRKRGKLTLAPKGKHGQGRHRENLWSWPAVEELITVADLSDL